MDNITNVTTDVLIVGAGIAGLYTALNINPGMEVILTTKENVDVSNSWLAQGGIAAAISSEDAPEFHMDDTIKAGAMLCDEASVSVLVDEGPKDIANLVKMNVPFDLTEEGELAMTREGGHTRNRIVHAGGDATGRETVKRLAAIALERDNITMSGRSFLVKLLTDGSRVTGALFYENNQFHAVWAGNTVLCTGGLGQLFSNTTNPLIATGDGMAVCADIGVRLKNMEFIQFHPTSLYDKNNVGRAFLISEAVRGEGALLVNGKGVRFMHGQHPMAELAPRDIVARAIIKDMNETGDECVFLDITAKTEDFLSRRFPTIYNECMERGINIAKDLIPVCPAQHYMVGGIETGLWGESSMPGLYAIGETACTGVHGANRLASNSMLECLVFGRRAAEHINKSARREVKKAKVKLPGHTDGISREYKTRIRRICDDGIGAVRSESGMRNGLSLLAELREELERYPVWDKDYWESRNMLVTADTVFSAALARKESLGTHYRVD